jgi:hypothetical protein
VLIGAAPCVLGPVYTRAPGNDRVRAAETRPGNPLTSSLGDEYLDELETLKTAATAPWIGEDTS